jgi:hypothetical protein
MASSLILACSSMKFLNCAQRGTKSWMDELSLNRGLPRTWPYSSHSLHVDLASAAFRCWASIYLHLLHTPLK